MKFSKLSEEEQFQILYRQYILIRRYLRAFRLTPFETEEILQDTMITVWRKIDTLRDEEKLDPWVRTIARNKIRKGYRKSAKARQQFYAHDKLFQLYTQSKHEQSQFNMEVGTEIEIEHEPLTEALLYDHLCKLEDSDIYEMIQQLGKPANIILTLHYGYLETFEEIAKTLDMKPSTVRSIAARSREKLKRMLEKDGHWYIRKEKSKE
ncbi:MAG: RNA polymerase sigma factor [Firmicutes bacterium]|nr:RNA polymerase sigma factor [Bacillota bacterium]